MNKMLKYTALTMLLAVFSGLSLLSQQLPSLKRASEIEVGKLPNGVSVYLVTNPSSRGYADFALVQRGQYNPDVSRSALVSLPHFTSVKPYEFVASKGIGCRRNGYISYTGGSTVFNFEKVPVFDPAASDSTLLMMFDLMGTYNSEQALIVSGDISTKSLSDRLYMLSLTVGERKTGQINDSYIWNPAPVMNFVHAVNSSDNVASISVTYSSPRTPRELMNTTQPLVSRIFATTLGYILERRVTRIFRARGIPVAKTDYRYFDSSTSSRDERYRFTVYIGKDHIREATDALAEIFSDLDLRGATLAEFRDAKDRLRSEAVKEAGRREISNGEYVRKCVSSFLYGSDLASPSSIGEFFYGRQIAPETELELFNNFVSALVDPQRALTLRYSTPEMTIDKKELSSRFASMWKRDSLSVGGTSMSEVPDTLGLERFKTKRVKLRATTVEPITGGSLWTFSNGVKVVYKREKGTGEFGYALLLKGGYASVPCLSSGESAFVQDMLSLSDVAGIPAVDFREMLASNGITMETSVSLSDMRIRGHAPKNKAALLLRSLVAVGAERRLNRQEFAYYKQSEELRQELFRRSHRGINAVMDSIMCPDYFYPETKNVACLKDNLPERAETYFRNQFSKTGDGMLVIIGDLDETELQKILCRTLGGFGTGGRYSVRPRVGYKLRSGWSTYTVNAALSAVGSGETCVNVAMTALRPFDMKTYAAFRIARVALERQVVGSLADDGLYVDISSRIDIFPVEKMSVFINCRPCSPDGIPEGIMPSDPLSSLGAVRSAINRVSSSDITPLELKGYKEALLNEMSSEMGRTDFLIDAVMMRNSEGKDIVTKYKDYIAAVTASDVKEILRALDFGSKVEYIVK